MNNTNRSVNEKVEGPTNSSNTVEVKEAQERYRDEDDSLLKKRPRANRGRTHSYREPITHLKNRTIFELLFGPCFGDVRTQLTIEELIPFYDVKNDANNYFDSKCTDYDDMLRGLWTDLTGEQLEEIQNDGWKQFGFQNSNPRSDFRGGALLSLKQLIYFVKCNKDKIPEMTKEINNFLFAVSSINVTYFLIKYYHLSDQLIYSKDKKEICSRVALKTFCSILRVDENVLNRIHSILLNDLYNVWQDLRANIPNLTLLDFNLALNVIKKKYTEVTRDNIFDDFETLRVHYMKKRANLPTRRASYS